MYVYCWHERSFDGIKVGRGNDPYRCMVQYARRHSLSCDASSLVMLNCYSYSRRIERFAHRILKEGGGLNFQGPREVFVFYRSPYGWDYEPVAHEVMQACRRELIPLLSPKTEVPDPMKGNRTFYWSI